MVASIELSYTLLTYTMELPPQTFNDSLVYYYGAKALRLVDFRDIFSLPLPFLIPRHFASYRHLQNERWKVDPRSRCFVPQAADKLAAAARWLC